MVRLYKTKKLLKIKNVTKKLTKLEFCYQPTKLSLKLKIPQDNQQREREIMLSNITHFLGFWDEHNGITKILNHPNSALLIWFLNEVSCYQHTTKQRFYSKYTLPHCKNLKDDSSSPCTNHTSCKERNLDIHSSFIQIHSSIPKYLFLSGPNCLNEYFDFMLQEKHNHYIF